MKDKEQDTAWRTHFAVIIDDYQDADLNLRHYQFFIVDVVTKERLYGPYTDPHYAEKQARHKYKKIVRSMEKMLMSK